jgi:hypothetical protein
MIANALPRPLTAGSVDNAILRADGTDGTILQSSGLIVEDAVVAYSATGDAATDVITATGHNFIANQGVMFSSLTGGSGLNTTTVYFVRDISGSTFKVSATSGGAAINFTTNITAGTVIAIQANVAISQNTTETNSALVLTPKGTGALIAGPKPDGTTTGGNARGAGAIDIQTSRTAATQVASGLAGICIGTRNAATANEFPSTAIGQSNTVSVSGSVAIGQSNTITAGDYGNVAIGMQNNASLAANSGAVAIGRTNTSAGSGAVSLGVGNQATALGSIAISSSSVANRVGMLAAGSGQFSATGDAQRARFVLRNKTTTNSAVELFLDGSATRLTIPSGKVLALTINISGISSTGAAVAHYMRQYALKNVSGTTSEVYAPITIGTDNAAGTSIALSASDASDALVVSVTGTASTIWRWVASVDAVEIAYGI